MGGFQFNGCGAKDYFKKIKYLGDQMCPHCHQIAPLYLEKGNFKVSVFWIPTVTLKERYAIMCEKCKEGSWIEDAQAYKLLSGNTYTPNEDVQKEAVTSLPKCPRCGAEVDGAFCGNCGAKIEGNSDTPKIQRNLDPPMEAQAKPVEVVSSLETKPIEVVSSPEWECYLCGTLNQQSSNKCSLCGCAKDEKY